MPAGKGSAFLLKVGDGAVPPTYATVAGLRTTQLSVNGEAAGGWMGMVEYRVRVMAAGS